MDVLWLPHPTLFAELLASTEDYAPQRHPTSPVYNFGFFFAQGANAEAFFGCLVREWDRRTLLQRALGHAVELASDQRFLYNAARRAPNAPRCGALSVRNNGRGLPIERHDGPGAEGMYVEENVKVSAEEIERYGYAASTTETLVRYNKAWK